MRRRGGGPQHVFACARGCGREAQHQQSVAITIYNENLALVKDTRRLALDAGGNRLALREVSGRMRAETAQLRSVSHPGALTVLEQNFDFDLLTPAKLHPDSRAVLPFRRARVEGRLRGRA